MEARGDHSLSKIALSVVWLTLFFLCPSAMGQQQYRITRIGAEQGLSEGHVYCVLQDSRGFMWFGTRDGLNRYDGYEFKIYRHDPDDENSISNNFVYALWEDARGDLWIGTNGGGLNRFDRTRERFIRYRHDPNDSNSLSHDIVRVIAGDSRKRGAPLWIGTLGGGLNRFDVNEGRFTHYRHDPNRNDSLDSDDIWSLTWARNDTVWVGSNDAGLNMMRAWEPGKFKRFGYNPGNPGGLTESGIWSLYSDVENTLWIGTESGLKRLGVGEDRIEAIQLPAGRGVKNIDFMMQTQDGALWMGTNIGLFRYDPAGGDLSEWRHDPGDPNTLAQNDVWGLYEDNRGNIWVTHFGNGISLMTLNPFDSYRAGDAREVASALLMDRAGDLWLGTSTSGLPRYENVTLGNKNRRDHPFEQPIPSISALLENRQGNLWIGTRKDGLYYYDRATEELTNFRYDPKIPDSLSGNWINTIFEDPHGVLWVGTDGGLDRMETDRPGVFTNYRPDPRNPKSLSDFEINCIFPSPENTLWLATFYGGLNRMALERPGDFVSYRRQADNPASLSSDTVFAIAQKQAGTLWLGTSNGLNRFDTATGETKVFLKQEGLAGNIIYSIVADDRGDLWLSTPKSLSHFDPVTEKFKSFDRNNGLAVDDFRERSGFRDANGRLYFGGVGGVVAFSPEDIIADPHPPQIALTSFLLNNQRVRPRHHDPHSPLLKSIEETDSVDLSYKDRDLTFRFTAMHYTAPMKNRLMYRLEGYDEDWIETRVDDGRANYTNLDPGSYTFHVKGSNPDGVWSKQKSLEIHIPTPPWKTWWAFGLYGLLLGSLVAAYLRGQRRKLRYERSIVEHLQQVDRLKGELNRSLEHKVAERTQQLQTRTRQLQARNQELETLDRIVEVINREHDLQDVLETILGEALSLIPRAVKGSVLLRNRHKAQIDIVATKGYGPYKPAPVSLTYEEMVSLYTRDSREVETGIYLLGPDAGNPGEHGLASHSGPASILAMALYLEGELEGFLTLANSSITNAFKDADFRKISRFRDHAVTAIAKAGALRDLIDAQRELTASAHEAGMAEIASEMLHNMGNVLNSVRTSGSIIREGLQDNKWQGLLERVSTFFSEETDHPSHQRNEKLVAILAAANAAVSKQQTRMLTESARMDTGLQNIMDMLEKQRRLTSSARAVVEIVDLNRIVEETLQSHLPPDKNIVVRKELEPLPPLMLEVMKLRRMVIFTYENAYKSIAGSKSGQQGEIRIVTSTSKDDIRLDVWDNGVGLDKKETQKVFSQDPLSESFGLHYCANAIKEMGGRIEIGRGQRSHSRVTLRFPIESEVK
ncbi:MAG: two-component regulator propeller domain-containing protein [Acidobacteriota bacterium]|nr:two-component regulator propeller domain-containing protein [Acidobacteriota bacterium]